MIRLNISELKARFSKYVDRLAKGESILLCKRNTPIAEIRPLPPVRKKPRPIGLAKGAFEIPPEFYDPLPSEVQASFEGHKL